MTVALDNATKFEGNADFFSLQTGKPLIWVLVPAEAIES